MKPIVLAAAASLVGLGLTAVPAQAKACACRVVHHRHVGYVRHVVYHRPYYRPYAYGYARPVYYRDYSYDPGWSYSAYYGWSDPAPVWVSYGGPDYGWHDGGWRWRAHHHWRDWDDRGAWHGHGHWDHGWHRGWR